MSLLDVREISVHYGKALAVQEVNLEVGEGEAVCIIGPNGAGKSTVLRAISGLAPLSAGEIIFDGERLDRLAAHAVPRRGVAHCPQGKGLGKEMTVLENLELGAYARDKRDGLAEDLDRVFALFPDLRERRHQRCGTLSGGQQQMVAIGRALMLRPRLLLLDEPSMGLAPILKERIFQRIEAIKRQGVTILLVEQDAGWAMKLCDRAYVLEDRRILMHGPTAELAYYDYIVDTYLGT
ncbi:MAG: ABC transporter ATP-binding protein [Candidatus Tectomicrobia bacterium]|nr:ABC transporter ATP-binding protein [Candidatus Tectomicrobia bacterium]